MEDLDRAPVEAAIARRTPLKARSDFNNYSVWKHKLRENCYRRVREDRGRLLWRMRLPDSEPCTSKMCFIHRSIGNWNVELSLLKQAAEGSDCAGLFYQWIARNSKLH